MYKEAWNLTVVIWMVVLCHTVHLQSDERGRKDSGSDESEDGPFFELENSTFSTNLTVQSGTDYILLNCPVNRPTKYSVSWLKAGDGGSGSLKLLTVDQVVYSPDSKLSLSFLQPNNFQLRLNQLTTGSSGEYYCQISSHPPKILRYQVNVVAPTIEIVDDGDRPLKDKIFKTESTLELRCRIFLCCYPPTITSSVASKIDSPPQHVSWFHDNRLLNNDTYRGGISVKSEMRRNDYAVSKLYVANVNKNDSGFYTCAMARFGKATVLVSVLNGETPAAMQAGGGGGIHLLPQIRIIVLLPLPFLFPKI